ncbi:ABC transporter family substrate-binding protein [Thermobifida halotolerans]|uniref:ABC transporter family substrate-binding protein n=1 Tax=Thermobifida halotolerans TaxID=483545 RepID=UPI000EECD561|nr:ABC transporter family substrate-binding protein [Thermobifida halotolerans]
MRIGKRRAIPAGAFLLALVTALAGCQTTVSGPSAAPEPATASINAADRARIADGGTVTWGVNDFPTQWNPHHQAGNLTTAHTVLKALLPAPFRTDEQGRAHPDPDYVTDVSVTTEPEQVVTLTLNPEARWSTGKPITWRDYAAMAEALSGADPDYQVLGAVGYDRISEVSAGEDRYQVVITFDRPFADYRALFSPLLPAEYTGTAEAFNAGYLEQIPVTAGPFEVEEIDPTAQTVTLRRDGDWWGQPAKLDRIVFRALAPEALDAAFLDGGVDLYALSLDSGSYERVRSAPDSEIRTALAPDYRHITLNGQSPILRDVDVRHAIFLGIDREVVTDAAFRALGWRPEVLGNRFLMPDQPGYTDNSGEWGGYDPERAARLLEEAGWTAEEPGEVRTRDGEPLTLRFVVPQGYAPAHDEAELVQAMLAEIGVEIEIKSVPGNQLFGGYVQPGNYDLVAFVNSGGGFPVSESLYQWADAVDGPDGEPQWRANVGRIGAKEIDEALFGALETLDADTAVERINEADRLLWEAGHTLPLYQRPQVYAVRDALANVGAYGLGTLDYADIGYLAED